jgi:hypothetical protein
MEEQEIKRLLRLVIKKELSIQDVTDAILSLHKTEVKNLAQPDVSGSDLVKSDWNLRECFKQLRFDKNNHLGLGDIRLTIAQQEEICDLVERFYHYR